MTTECLYKNIQAAHRRNDEENLRILLQSQSVLGLLEYCSLRPGATITIIIEHNDDIRAKTDLYDHAALVQALTSALEEFQDEIAWISESDTL